MGHSLAFAASSPMLFGGRRDRYEGGGGMMRRPQVSIAGLVLTILVVALGLAAVRSGSPAWSGATVSIMLFALICSLLGVGLARGRRRVYWIGFASLGWSALLLLIIPWLFENLGQFLLAPNLFEYLDPILHPGEREEVLTPAPGGFRSMAAMPAFGGAAPAPRATDLSPFQKIGAALEVLLWAYLGGWAALWYASGPGREGPGTATTPAPDAARARETP